VRSPFLGFPYTHQYALKDIAHTFLDLLIAYTQSSTSSANTSPSTPSSPSPHLTRDRQHHQHFPHHHQLQHFATYPYNADQLIRLKIFMRQTEHSPRTRSWNVNVAEQSTENNVAANVVVNEGLGKNEGTTRFSFFPPGFQGDGHDR